MAENVDADLPLDQRDQVVANSSMQTEGDSVRLVDDLLILINHGTSAFNGRKHDRGLNFLIALLTSRAFNSLWRARECAVDGYPVQAMTLARAALEDWVAVRWLEEKPDKKDLWLGRMLPEVVQPRDARGRELWIPSADAMLKELPEGDSPLEAYRQLSRVAHPRGTGLGWQFHADAESLFVHSGPHFDQRDLRRALFFIVHIAAGFLPCIERLQVRWRGEADKQWVERGSAAVEEARAFLRKVGEEVSESGDEEPGLGA